MSRNTKKITTALAVKGYQPREMHWEPMSGCDFGTDGGWYIDVETIATDEYGDHDYVDTILAYSTAEALEETEQLPDDVQAGERIR